MERPCTEWMMSITHNAWGEECWIIGPCVCVCVCTWVCLWGCLPYSFFCVRLPFVCVHRWQGTRCHAPSALPLWQAVCECVCMCLCVCVLTMCVRGCFWNPVRATETAWVWLWENKCMSVVQCVSWELTGVWTGPGGCALLTVKCDLQSIQTPGYFTKCMLFNRNKKMALLINNI